MSALGTSTSDSRPASRSSRHVRFTKPGRSFTRPRRSCPTKTKAQNGGNDLDADDFLKNFSLGKLVKKVQGAIPVVSLLSKLFTPEGGFDGEALSYNEYTRIRLDQAGGTEFGAALSDLCDETKKEPRTLLLLTWMAFEGEGLLGPEIVTSASRRLASSGFDYEYEIYRFESARDEAIAVMKKKSGKRARNPETAKEVARNALTFALAGESATDELKKNIELVAEGATASL